MLKNNESKLLEVKNLKTYFYVDGGVIKAVDDVTFSIGKSKVLCVVGESGCGKSVTALSIIRLIPSPPGKIEAGEILYKGRNLLALNERDMRRIRGNDISMIFQEPMTSLNPVFTVGNQIEEAIKLHQNISKSENRNKTIEMLRLVGIPTPEKRYSDYPHQLSGGMRQRVMIAMALSCKPEILIADEPTTALDVTIAAQILDLIKRLKDELAMSVMLITHDLGVVAESADDVIVMYAGKICEIADVTTIFERPLHPYTIGLKDSIPSGKGGEKRLKTIHGTVPDLLNLPAGCAFQERCSIVSDLCRREAPELQEAEKEHFVMCHNYIRQ